MKPVTTVTEQWNGDKIDRNMAEGAVDGLNNAARRLGALSMPLVPLDTAALRQSQRIVLANLAHLTSAVSYGTVYAVRQHEEHDWNHSVGQSDYLGQPARDHSAELMKIIAGGISARLNS